MLWLFCAWHVVPVLRLTLNQLIKAAAPAASAEEPAVKKSTTSICHDKSSASYKQTKNFTEFKTMDECIKSGGRAPKGGK